MKYERITDKEHRYKKCVDCKYRNCQYCDDKPDYEREGYNRLVELEDEIEQKRLVELPCKVGDTVYQLDNAGNVYESKIKGLIYDAGHIAFDERAIGKTIFLTREEVEKHLKEVKK